MRSPLTLALCLTMSALMACQQGPNEDLPTASAHAAALKHQASRVVLDQRDNAPDGELNNTLSGYIEAVKPGTDAPRIITLSQLPAGLKGLAQDQRVLDARFIADGVVTLGADQTLRYHTRHEVITLDAEVLGPLSVAQDKIAYVRGEAPDLSVMRVDVHRAQPVALAPDLMPAWSPALSEDGEQVIFAASYEGRGRLFQVDATGARRIVLKGGSMPSSPTAPQWRGDLLYFEDEQGVAVVDLRQGAITARHPKDALPTLLLNEPAAPSLGGAAPTLPQPYAPQASQGAQR